MDGADFTQLPMQKWCIGDIISFSHHLARFTSELARLFRAYGEGSGLEPITLKAARTNTEEDSGVYDGRS